MKKNTIETDRLILRPWVASDIEPFATMGADPKVMAFFPALYTHEQAADWLIFTNQSLAKSGFTFWAIEIPGVTPFAGFTGLLEDSFEAPFTPCVQIGWRLAHKYWGQGYVSEAAKASLEYGFVNCELDEIVAYAVPGNTRSFKVMERIGMHHDIHGDFNHPHLEKGHTLERHVLYRLSKSDWLKQLEA